jgi:hypothetical protein
MMATMLFAIAGPANAADPIKPSNPATFSACPANAGITDAGFDDVPAGTFFADAVNCLAYYGVTVGKPDGNFGVADDVTRAQMAVFLYRMAPVAGVVLSSTPPDAGFTDIGNLSTEAQTAINALAAKGIVKGKTTTTYAPADTVWRQQMALFLKRFSDAASAPATGPGGTQAKNTTGTKVDFTDLGGVTVETNTAIIDVFHLGVAAGTTATTFDPLGNVNRGQMALFLTRLAAHQNVRPAGVNIQVDKATGNDISPSTLTSQVSVTARTTGFLPAPNTTVDQFRFPSTNGVPASAFLADGTCNPANVLSMGSSTTPCSIELIDPSADTYGNFPVYTVATPDGYVHELYAWTGATGAKFDKDTTTYSMVTVTTSAVADGWTFKLDGSTTTPQSYKFPATATWVIQVTSGGKPLAQAGWTFVLQTQQMDPNGVSSGQTGVQLKTDANGQIVITQSFSDPDTTTTGDTAYFQGRITNTPSAQLPNTSGYLRANWSDVTGTAKAVKLSTATGYAVSANGAGNVVTAKVTDEYGAGVPDVPVCFTSVDGSTFANGIGGTDVVRTTGPTGEATLGYAWTWLTGADTENTARIETISATVDDDGNAIPCDDGTPITATNLDFYWVDVAASGDTVAGYTPVLVADVANKAVVGASGAIIRWWQWDAGDQFNVTGAPATMEAFETQIAKDPTTPQEFSILSYNPAGVSNFWVQND